MSEVRTIGLDLAKHIFQVHGADASGAVVFRKQLRRGQVLKFFGGLPRCLVAMEACGSSYFWAREIGRLGHEVRMIPPAYVQAVGLDQDLRHGGGSASVDPCRSGPDGAVRARPHRPRAPQSGESSAHLVISADHYRSAEGQDSHCCRGGGRACGQRMASDEDRLRIHAKPQ